jgi:hypothetical protein
MSINPISVIGTASLYLFTQSSAACFMLFASNKKFLNLFILPSFLSVNFLPDTPRSVWLRVE